MADSGVKIAGLRDAVKALQVVGVPDAEIKLAGQQSGEAVANEARSLVPVRSGKLRDTIRVGKALRKVTISAGNNRATGVPYANPIHWGWFKRNIIPQPFFTKAIGITRNEVYNNYLKQLDRLLEAQKTKGTD
jgi:hypothetical protein